MWNFGKINGYDYEVKAYEEPSNFGINGGKISKLFIKKGNEVLVGYDREWDKHATPEMQPILDELIAKYN